MADQALREAYVKWVERLVNAVDDTASGGEHAQDGSANTSRRGKLIRSLSMEWSRVQACC
jgi:hypothetical protein